MIAPYPHSPRKRFGQHFLKNPAILERILDALQLKQDDRVIEIGPGQGALTRYLLTEVTHLDAIELDRDLALFLQNNFEPEQLTLHQQDALRFSYRQLSRHPHDLRIVGNLPYNISTPLLFALFSVIDCVKDMHFMLQKEVVLRLTAPVGDANYGRLSVMSQYFCHNKNLFTVPPNAFNPPPKVHSAVVRLTPIQRPSEPLTDFSTFSMVVREAFNYRRKMLGNCLKRLISHDQLIKLDIDPNARPQTITVSQFIRISNAIATGQPPI